MNWILSEVAKHVIYLILVLHWFADFFLQTDKMAMGKSKSNYWLGVHIGVYMIPFLVLGWMYALVNGAVHFCVDYVTSRINSRLWKAQKVHWFFVGVGFDQTVHYCTLKATMGLIHFSTVPVLAGVFLSGLAIGFVLDKEELHPFLSKLQNFFCRPGPQPVVG